MSWLYRFQQRAGLTGIEGTAAVVAVIALGAGFGLRAWDTAAAPVAPDFYAAADAAFVAAGAAPGGDGPGTALQLVSAEPPGTVAADGMHAEPHGHAEDDSAAVDAGASAARVAERAVRASSERSRAGKPPPVRTNLNTASAEQLQRLPRIGPALAQRIIEYRQTHGRFRSAEQVTEVKGIGDKTLEHLRPWIFV